MTQIITPDQPAPKYAGIASALRERIRSMEPGEKLQSVRQLMQEFDVSQATVYSALDLLKSEGAVVHEKGRGIRVPMLDEEDISTVMLLVAERATSPFHQRLLFEACRIASKYRLRFLVESFPLMNKSGQQWPPAEVRAGIFIPGQSGLTPEILTAWRRQNLPLVVMDRDLSGIGVDCVYSDQYRGGWLAARHLVDMGHTNIGVIQHKPQSPNLLQRIKGFLDAVEDSKGRVEVNIFQPEELEDVMEIGTFACETLADNPEITGLFVMTHRSSTMVLGSLQANGWKIPQQISLVGYDFLQHSPHSILTTIDQSIEDIADATCRILRSRLDRDDSDVLHHVSKPKLVLRGSTIKIG